MGIPKKWIVILSGALFYAYQFILRVAPNLMNDDWLQHFSMDANAFGFVISLYSWSYALIQIPLGLMLDRFGAGRLMVLAAFMCAISCFMLSSTHSIFIASCAMFLMGLGSACAFLGSIKLGTVWFNSKDLAKVVALVIVFGTIGAVIGNKPLSALIEAVGWQTTLYILGLLGLALSIFMYLTVGRVQEPQSDESYKNVLEGFKKVISRPQAWLIALYGTFMYCPITIYGTGWGIPFVKASTQLDEGMASYVMTSMFVGAAIGSPIFAYYSDRICQRVKPMLMGALLGLAVEIIVVFIPNIPLNFLFVLFFLVGFCYTAKTLSFTAVCEIMPKSCSGVAVGFLNTLTMGAGALYHPLMGKLIVSHWDGTVQNGTDIYSEWDYRFALIIIPVLLAGAVILMRYIKETHHTGEYDRG
jgi:sugar phosphate permease